MCVHFVTDFNLRMV